MSESLFPTIKPEEMQRGRSGPAQWGAYAYFPASGPRDKTCGDCRFFAVKPGRKNVHVCLQFAKLVNKAPSKVPSIRAEIACKYFQPFEARETD